MATTTKIEEKQIFLTKEGLEELKLELKNLEEVKRPALLQRVTDARSQGDLSENSDYASAKEELDMIDGRIDELSDIIFRAKLIQNSPKVHRQVELGSTITVTIKGKEHLYTIVGEWEADPMEKKLSHDSPLGKALIGKKEGDSVEVEAPAGKISYTVVKIH